MFFLVPGCLWLYIVLGGRETGTDILSFLISCHLESSRLDLTGMGKRREKYRRKSFFVPLPISALPSWDSHMASSAKLSGTVKCCSACSSQRHILPWIVHESGRDPFFSFSDKKDFRQYLTMSRKLDGKHKADSFQKHFQFKPHNIGRKTKWMCIIMKERNTNKLFKQICMPVSSSLYCIRHLSFIRYRKSFYKGIYGHFWIIEVILSFGFRWILFYFSFPSSLVRLDL